MRRSAGSRIATWYHFLFSHMTTVERGYLRCQRCTCMEGAHDGGRLELRLRATPPPIPEVSARTQVQEGHPDEGDLHDDQEGDRNRPAGSLLRHGWCEELELERTQGSQEGRRVSEEAFVSHGLSDSRWPYKVDWDDETLCSRPDAEGASPRVLTSTGGGLWVPRPWCFQPERSATRLGHPRYLILVPACRRGVGGLATAGFDPFLQSALSVWAGPGMD